MYYLSMDTFSALADPTRRHIIEMLATRGQLSATDIYGKFNVSPPAISQHLKVLREAKLVDMEKHAQKRLYTINSAKLSEIEEWLKKLRVEWDARFNRLDKVLDTLKREEENHGRK